MKNSPNQSTSSNVPDSTGASSSENTSHFASWNSVAEIRSQHSSNVHISCYGFDRPGLPQIALFALVILPT